MFKPVADVVEDDLPFAWLKDSLACRRASCASAAERQRGDLTMPEPKLQTVTRTQGNNEALKDGTVTPRGFTFDFARSIR